MESVPQALERDHIFSLEPRLKSGLTETDAEHTSTVPC